ncbi:papilin isoform X2 [Ascaphus truei]|uniref:papilin isoform X2 n=1 Tax=Ascaphus truei TaxID=8439 RepID=UPI003F593061
MKIPLLLVTLVLESVSSGRKTKRQNDLWDNWGEWGECSRSCDGGVSVRERLCYSGRADGGSNCIGPTKNHRSCNVQECPEGSPDFRAEQCSEYDGMEFQGKRHKWLPYYGASNKCELNCIPKGENFYYRHKMAVLDGTPCEPGRRDICVEGVCKTVGCDNMLDSTKKEDRCLVCGGDGSSCYEVKGSYDSPSVSKGYSQIFIIPSGATNLQIKEVTATRNFLAVKNARGEYYLNGHWTIEFSRGLHVASTVLHYYRGSEGDLAPELLSARGPTTEPLVIELIGQETNQGVQYEYYISNQGDIEEYQWSYGSWSECSAECGGGYQSRLVFCTIDNEAYPDYMCRQKPAPSHNRTCSTQPCPQMKRISYIYQPGLWSRSGWNTKMNSWKASEWGPCSASCGGGTQTRSVYCISYEGRASHQVVSDADCATFTEKPSTQQICNLRSCAKWSVGPWTECSTQCGEGIQKRTITCRTDSGSVVQEFACLLQIKPMETQLCYGEDCIQEIGWHIGEWGLCSKSCGNGIRKRQVICADSDRNFYDPEKCEEQEPEKPSLIENCNLQPCYLQQQVPSMQDTRGYDNSNQFTLTRYSPESASRSRRPSPDRYQGNEDPGSNFLPNRPNNPSNPNNPNRPSNPNNPNRPNNPYNPNQPNNPYNPNQPNNPYNPNQPSNPNQPNNPSQPTDCRQSAYGCCSDGYTPASGPAGQGCPVSTCQQSRYGCCPDGITAAQGPYNERCPQYYSDGNVGRNERADPSPALPSDECRVSQYGCCFDNTNRAAGPVGEGCRSRPSHSYPIMCVLPSALGPCSEWTTRWFFVADVGKCNRFWYGGCHGNKNNFATEEECMETCQQRPQLNMGNMERRYHRPNMNWHRMTHIREGVHEGDPHGKEHSEHQHPMTVRTLDQDRADHILSGQGWGDRGMRHGATGHATEQPRHGTEHKESSSSHHSSIYRIILDKAESSAMETSTGQTVRLLCRVSDYPYSKVDWQKDGRPVSSSRHIYQSDSSLVISHVGTEDAGVYTCMVSNGDRSETHSVRLQVRGHRGSGDLKRSESSTPETSAVHSRSSQLRHSDRTSANDQVVMEANLGQRTKLSCLRDPSPSTVVDWQKDGKLLSSSRHRKQADGSLIISRVSSEDAGLYTCSFTHGASRELKQIQLIIRGELKITDPPTSVTVSEGETAELRCIVRGENVNVQWSRNGVPVRSDGRHTHVSQDGNLIIRNTQPTDEGSYTCNAYSGTHSVSANADIKVTRSRAAASPVTAMDPNSECIDHPELANCDLIVYAQLCSNEYYSSFCCASCSGHQSEPSQNRHQG